MSKKQVCLQLIRPFIIQLIVVILFFIDLIKYILYYTYFYFSSYTLILSNINCFCIEELIFKLEEDVSLGHGEKKVRKFERAPRPNRLSTHVS